MLRKGWYCKKFTAQDDLIIFKESSAAEAHDARYGYLQLQFSGVASQVNLNIFFRRQLSPREFLNDREIFKRR